MRVPAWFLGVTTILWIAACGGRDNSAANPAPDLQALQQRTFDTLWSTVNEHYVYDDFNGVDWAGVRDRYRPMIEDELEPEEFTALLERMLAELPPAMVSLQTRQARIEAAASDDRSYEGIGSFVALRREPESRILLLSVMPGSPAEAAGLKSHDAILAIDGQPVVGDAATEIARVRGPAGSKIVLTVRSPGQAPRDVPVTRGTIDAVQNRLAWDEVGGEAGLGYFLFPSANYETMVQDLVVGLQELDNSGNLDGLILDLRIVSAGENWPVGSLLSLFTDGTVGEFYTRQEMNPIDITGIFDFLDSQELPVVLIVGPSTTGSAEIFAAIMKAQGKAILVGQSTLGDVETSTPYFLPDGSRAYVATTTFRTNDGTEVGLNGVVPDIPVPLDWDEVTIDDDPVIDAAGQQLRRLLETTG